MKIYRIKELLSLANDKVNNQEVVSIKGWVRTNRDSGKIGFIEAYDGSNLNGIQIVYKKESTNNFDLAKTARTGAAILASGIISPNNRTDSGFELVANSFELLKQSDEDFPLQKKQHTMEFLRDIAHLRGRTKTMQATMRVRNQLMYAIHKFFQTNDFKWIATPILTSNDCEGAGENFIIEENPNNPFFTPKASLTVSGQLNVETYCQSFGRVYTFGPTFRADRSHTNRHLAEFWMIEPEIAFIELPQMIQLIEQFIKSVCQDVIDNCNEEIQFFMNQNPVVKERLDNLINKEFKKLEYREAIDLLIEAKNNGHKFEDDDIFFGKDLASEHERYICEKIFNCPVFLMNYPKDIKAFYMKQNDDGQTVAASDLLVPGVGEIVGGSQREDDYNKLLERTKAMNIDTKGIQWYLDLRKYGYYQSCGFGLGFERLIMYILGIENVRDTIPFPRYEGKINW